MTIGPCGISESKISALPRVYVVNTKINLVQLALEPYLHSLVRLECT